MARNRHKALITGILTCAALCLAAAGADAGSKKGRKDKKTAAEAKEHHAKAVKFYKEGDYEQALEYFEKADELAPNPVTRFNIARCYDKLERYEEAYEHYAKYVESGDEARLEDAEEAMERIEAMPVKITIITSPKSAEVFIDGEPLEDKRTPVEVETEPGQHTVFIRKDGYESVEEGLEIPPGGQATFETELVEADEEAGGEGGEGGGLRLKARAGGAVPISVYLGVGATASTSDTVTSYVSADIGVAYRIKDFAVGVGLDNMFFSDSYLLAAYPAGSYTLGVWKDLSLNFAVGFGAAYLYSSEEVRDPEGGIRVKSGNMWDLVVHADAKLRYKIGPVMLMAVPLSCNVFVGAGNIKPSPLAQFAFLAGVAYDF